MGCCAQAKHCTAVVADLFDFWQETLLRISGKSKLAVAIRYAVSRRAVFEHFPPAAALSSTTTVERAISSNNSKSFSRAAAAGQTLAAIRNLPQTT
ncbi:hypothetical protein [Bradyrhizobium sp. CCBAU 21360]|uniref:hypothetical protein n=1 Tax=Bradyrhizobium sp. CCBAU 21360 TaxID=1325081 RepID=UPI002305BB8D|nr:hypothetical protein [Bradyrhizobium sp. CCBAU 21360]MDA9447854.1 hypothetical protein [Bradyrhizobium sp. CCBAU 21360]